MLKLVLIALEILKRIQQSRGTIKVSLTYQSQCSGITYQDALNTLHGRDSQNATLGSHFHFTFTTPSSFKSGFRSK